MCMAKRTLQSRFFVHNNPEDPRVLNAAQVWAGAFQKDKMLGGNQKHELFEDEVARFCIVSRPCRRTRRTYASRNCYKQRELPYIRWDVYPRHFSFISRRGQSERHVSASYHEGLTPKVPTPKSAKSRP
jgi:hypothetical protein